jgi:hypothetical protein
MKNSPASYVWVDREKQAQVRKSIVKTYDLSKMSRPKSFKLSRLVINLLSNGTTFIY